MSQQDKAALISQDQQKDLFKIQDSNEENLSEKNISATNGLKENEISSMANKSYQHNCQLCDYKTDHDDIFNQHILIHEQKLLKCKRCPYSTHIWDSYKLHQQIHDEPGLYSCPHCDFTSNFMIRLKQHKCLKDIYKKHLISQPTLRNCNSPLRDISKGYTCDDCDFQTQVKGIMKLHSLLHYSQLFTCSHCPFKTTFDTLLALHEQKHTKGESSDSHPIKNSDSHCGKNSFLESHPIKGPSSDSHVLNPLSSESICAKDSDIDSDTHYEKYLSSNDSYADCHSIQGSSSNTDYIKDSGSTLLLPQLPKYLYDSDSIKDSSSYSHQKKFCHDKKKYILRSSNDSHSFSETVINSKKKFNCLFCGYVSSVAYRLKRHLYTHDFDAAHPTLPNETYICPFCSCQTDSLGKWKRHFLIAHLYDTPKSKEATNSKPSKQNKSKLKKKYMTWPSEEKKEIYWCHTYSKHEVFERVGMSERRRSIMLKRGILNPEKVRQLQDARFQNIVANMKMGRTKITEKEMEEIEKDVENYIRNHWPHKKISPFYND